MEEVYRTLFLESAESFASSFKGSFLIDKDLFSGEYVVYDMDK